MVETVSVGATRSCGCRSAASGEWVPVSEINTLAFNAAACLNCGMCSAVCPHGVFEAGERAARVVRPAACMECGACQRNCPAGAIRVESGVGCAAAMIQAALTGRQEVSCGGPESGSGSGCGCG